MSERDSAATRPGYAKSYLAEPDPPLPRVGVWRRGPTDWAYRVEVEGYGSIAGVGFRSRDEARKAMHDARIDAWKRRELSND